MEGFPKHKQVVGPVWGMFLSGSVGGTILEIALFCEDWLGGPKSRRKASGPWKSRESESTSRGSWVMSHNVLYRICSIQFKHLPKALDPKVFVRKTCRNWRTPYAACKYMHDMTHMVCKIWTVLEPVLSKRRNTCRNYCTWIQEWSRI